MITTPEEYLKYLWGIETQEPLLDDEGNQVVDEEGNVIMVDVNPYNNVPILSIILPSDERTFDVDLNTREISVPTFLSVAKDHRAETVYFLVDRYYEYKDLAQTSCMIEFINAAGEGGFYPVPFYDISSYPYYIDDNDVVHEAKMLIPWLIEGDVTKTAGNVQFVLRFYELDDANEKFIFNLRTKIATGAILNGMDESVIDASIDNNLMSNIAQQINAKLDQADSTIYWTDLSNYEIASTSRVSPITGETMAYQTMLENTKKK